MTYIDYANRYWRVARANFASNNSVFLYLPHLKATGYQCASGTGGHRNIPVDEQLLKKSLILWFHSFTPTQYTDFQ